VNGNNPALDAGEPSHAHKDHERLDKQNLALIERIEVGGQEHSDEESILRKERRLK
jgi:hypothetical protein